MGTDATTTTNTTKTETTATSTLDTIKTTVMDWLSNDMVKLGAAGVGGFIVGYAVRFIQGMFSK
jgi:uncharacterized membrane protein (Fun14 family)